jgi:SAM-dependent methyltransferase
MATRQARSAGTDLSVDDRVWAGAAFYSRRNLRFYDVMLAFNCRVLWRCPRPRLVELYDDHVTVRHLDIGVATGWLLDAFPVAEPAITLMDLNPDTLAVAAARLARYRPTTHRASVLEPFGLPADSLDSVSMSLLLHCLPSAMSSKVPVVFDHVRSVLAPGGVIFGATLLNGGVHHTALSRRAMEAINRRGEFNNLDDNLDDLDAALARAYGEHELRVRGAMALFSAQSERSSPNRSSHQAGSRSPTETSPLLSLSMPGSGGSCSASIASRKPNPPCTSRRSSDSSTQAHTTPQRLPSRRPIQQPRLDPRRAQHTERRPHRLQLDTLVVIESVISALQGRRLRWQRVARTGQVEVLR